MVPLARDITRGLSIEALSHNRNAISLSSTPTHIHSQIGLKMNLSHHSDVYKVKDPNWPVVNH